MQKLRILFNLLGVGMAGEYQKELFGEFEKEKGKIERIAERITRARRRPYIHMPAENAIFAVIVVVMCVVVAFALGVEKGKRIAAPKKTESGKTVREAGPEAQREEIAVKDENVKKAAREEINRLYTVQLISYRRKAPALRERDRLRAGGHEVFIIESGNWFQVCAGSYGTAGDARVAQKDFLKEYKGCFVRKK